MTDYSFMKTGTFYQNNNQELIRDIRVLITMFFKNALKSSATYTKHAGRSIVVLDDIIRSLKLEAFMYTKRANMMDEFKQMKENLPTPDEIMDAIEDQYEDNVDEELNTDEDSEEEEYTKSVCVCELCTLINSIDESWMEFVPQNPIDFYIKKHIDSFNFEEEKEET